MAESAPKKSSGISVDWLVKGTLTKVGDIFDRLTGRGWKPSSSLATSGLVERMKAGMDSEARENGNGRRYVPHNIKLKMQWDKFSTDSSEALAALENELLIAAVDHINDRHYFTYAPLRVEVKPDYFTEGVVLTLGFEKLDSEDREAAINLTVDGLKKQELFPDAEPEKIYGTLVARFEAGGKRQERTITIEQGRRISIGRTKDNDLPIDDHSISKAHASLLLSKEGKLVVADTGSTNGTFVGGQRIAYGKAAEVKPGESLMFGLVNVALEFNSAAPSAVTEVLSPGPVTINGLEFSSREGSGPDRPLAPTAPAVPVKKESIAPAQTGKTEVSPQPALSEHDIKVGGEEG